MTWRPGIALAEPEVRNKMGAAVVEVEFQPHALKIVLATCEAEILFPGVSFGEMPMGRFFHQGEL
jgi:hypothetical protein